MKSPFKFLRLSDKLLGSGGCDGAASQTLHGSGGAPPPRCLCCNLTWAYRNLLCGVTALRLNPALPPPPLRARRRSLLPGGGGSSAGTARPQPPLPRPRRAGLRRGSVSKQTTGGAGGRDRWEEGERRPPGCAAAQGAAGYRRARSRPRRSAGAQAARGLLPARPLPRAARQVSAAFRSELPARRAALCRAVPVRVAEPVPVPAPSDRARVSAGGNAGPAAPHPAGMLQVPGPGWPSGVL